MVRCSNLFIISHYAQLSYLSREMARNGLLIFLISFLVRVQHSSSIETDEKWLVKDIGRVRLR